MKENLPHLEKLLKVFNADSIISSDEVEQILSGVLNILNNYKAETQQLNSGTKQDIDRVYAAVAKERQRMTELVESKGWGTREEVSKELADQRTSVLKEVQNLLTEVKSIMPENGKDADEEVIIGKVLSKITLPEYKETVLDDGEKIVAKINDLSTTEDEYLIDASHIKNLPKQDGVAAGARVLSSLFDVSIVNPTNNQVLKYNSTDHRWENGIGGSGSSVWGSITGTLSNQADLQSALNAKVTANGAITGATKTKITYDSKGLVTAGADATTADIADSSNRRYVTDAQLIVIGNTSGTNTGDQTITLTGDVTGSGTGSFATTIGNSKVTYAKIQNVTTQTLLGRYAGTNGVTQEITIGSGLSLNSSTGVLTATGGGGGTPGGSNTQLQYNNAGSFGGTSGLTWDSTNLALSLAQGTITTSHPLLNLSSTWNNAATVFTGLLYNVTDTASDATSLLADLQVGSSSKLNVTKAGALSIASHIRLENDTQLQIKDSGGNYKTVIRVDSADNLFIGRGGQTNIQMVAQSSVMIFDGSVSNVVAEFDAVGSGFLGKLNQVVWTTTGRVGISVASPSAKLHLPAVTTAANTAPLKFTLGGTLLTAPENGAVEATNSHIYWTDSTGTRYQLDQQSGSGTVTSVSVVTANGISGSVATATTTPAITLTLGAITPSSIVTTGAITSGGSFSVPYRAITALRTLDNTDNVIDCTANSFAVTLPTAVGITGRMYTIKNSGSGTTITVATTSAQTIDGASTLSIATQYQSYTVISDGANWKVI